MPQPQRARRDDRRDPGLPLNGTPQPDDLTPLYDHAPCGLLVLHPDGTIVHANRTTGEWTGHDPRALAGRRLHDLLKVGDRIYYETHLAPLLAMHGIAQEIAVDIQTADGTRLPVLLNAVQRPGGAGRPDTVHVALFRALDRRRYERELLEAKRRAEDSEAASRRLARTLQASLMPPVDPEIPGIGVGAAYRPAGAGDIVGGDFYDVFQTRPDEWMVVIGDVCGKGIEAAILTGYARYTIRGASMEARRPRDVLGALNAAFLLDHPHSTCTVLLVTVTARPDGSTRMVVAAGGHPLPRHATAAGDTVEVGRPGTLIGAFPDPRFHEITIDPAPGEALILITDGVTEARAGTEFYGGDRLEAFVGRHGWADARRLASGLADDAVAFQDGDPRDDIAVVVLRRP